MKTKIHINQHNIKSNKKNKTKLPVISAKTYKNNKYGNTVRVNGPCEIIYRPENPLPCGAVCWVETDSEVIVLK